MDFIKDVIGAAADVESTKLYASIDESFEAKFDQVVALVQEQNEDLDESAAVSVAETMGRDKFEQVMSLDEEDEGEKFAKRSSLVEAVDEAFQADVQLLESVSDLSIVAVYDLVTESFEQAVERILKSDRKLRMTSKDGKTKYKTRRRAAEAAAAASMAAVFGKKGVSRKAAGGK